MSVRGTFFDAYSRLRGHRVAAYRAEYEKALLSESGETIRRNRLRLVLDRARQDIPYYRDLAVGPQRDVFDELQRYPILTKDIIRPNRERLRAPDIENRHWYTNTSGGSTGEPIQLIQDREYADRSAALNAVLYGRMGYRFGQRQYRIWGSERDILQGRSATTRFWNFVYNSEILNAFRMSPETMREYLRILDRNPPRLLVCYAQAGYELARFALEHEIAIAAPQAMTCSAGTLYPFMRETIERAFGCPVYNWYGSREVGVIATQLPGEPLLWIPPMAQHVEIVDEAGVPVPAGVEGEILVTSLSNLSMPLIRYRIGDRGALAPSDDGIQRLTHVAGRNVDTFRTRDGTLVDGEYFTHLLYFRDWVHKFQFVQADFERIVLRVEPSRRFSRDEAAAALQAALPEILPQVHAVLGPKCQLEARLVDEIPTGSSGKHRYTICEIGGTQAA